jgi:hypothetical protein
LAKRRNANVVPAKLWNGLFLNRPFRGRESEAKWRELREKRAKGTLKRIATFTNAERTG